MYALVVRNVKPNPLKTSKLYLEILRKIPVPMTCIEYYCTCTDLIG